VTEDHRAIEHLREQLLKERADIDLLLVQQRDALEKERI